MEQPAGRVPARHPEPLFGNRPFRAGSSGLRAARPKPCRRPIFDQVQRQLPIGGDPTPKANAATTASTDR